jgi:hypothetical protein
VPSRIKRSNLKGMIAFAVERGTLWLIVLLSAAEAQASSRNDQPERGEFPCRRAQKHPPAAPSSAKEKPKKDETLDEAIADRMIASDPPASVSKGKPTAPPRRTANGSSEHARDRRGK